MRLTEVMRPVVDDDGGAGERVGAGAVDERPAPQHEGHAGVGDGSWAHRREQVAVHRVPGGEAGIAQEPERPDVRRVAGVVAGEAGRKAPPGAVGGRVPAAPRAR